ncbi:MAG: 4-hydroxy-tetrahydrodipicolinate synthase [Oscillospiraceae bacterium]|nr:4-hydroxy-tetrahydrodipicolinate synthase [Oscillospiraceae bacterium]
MKTPIFKGSCTAIVTPFKNDFVDFEKLGELVDEQINAGTSALVVCGTTGEASTQSIPEHLASVEYAVKHSAGRVPVIAGTGSNDTAHALLMSQSAEKSGADALLIVTPYYNKCSQSGLVKHFTYVADRVNIPIILYNVPSRTGMSFTTESYYELSKHPRINGTKEASGNMGLIAASRAKCGDNLNFWSGNDNETLAMMAMGGMGVISVAANVIPKEMAKICSLFYEGNLEAAQELFYKYIPLMDALFMDVNPIPVKTAMNLMGKNVGHLRMPLCDMSGGQVEKLKAVMKEAGVL